MLYVLSLPCFLAELCSLICTLQFVYYAVTQRATQALDPNWLRSVTVAPLILQSPAVPFLIGYRYADTVGHSPSAACDSGRLFCFITPVILSVVNFV